MAVPSRAMSRTKLSFSGLRRASFSFGVTYGSPVRWNANTLSVPRSRKSSATWFRTLASTEATRTTVTMPMTIPAIASADRARSVRSESIASAAGSAIICVHVVLAITPASAR